MFDYVLHLKLLQKDLLLKFGFHHLWVFGAFGTRSSHYLYEMVLNALKLVNETTLGC